MIRRTAGIAAGPGTVLLQLDAGMPRMSTYELLRGASGVAVGGE